MRTRHPITWLAAALTAAILPVLPATPAVAASGSWATGASTQDEHVSAVPVGDGRVLAAGGAVPEVFDASTGSWQRTSDDPANLRPRVLVRLTDGRVLATGDDGNVRRDAELFEPTTGLWVAATGMATPHRDALGVATADNRALVVGRPGYHDRTTAEVFSGPTATWTPTAAPSDDHDGGALVLLASGEVLLAGGMQTTPSAEIWSPATGLWRRVAAPPAGFCRSAAVRLTDGNVLFAGGRSCSSSSVYGSSDPLVYDVEADRWRTAGATRLIERTSPSMTLLPDGRVLIVGSGRLRTHDGSLGTASDVAELYDPATDLWSSAGATPRPHHGDPAALLPGGRVLVVGSSPDTTATDLYSATTAASATPVPGGPAAALHSSTALPWGHVGRPVDVVGRLVMEGSRQPLAGEVVDLYGRAPDADDWTRLGSTRTDASGTAFFRPTFGGVTTYALRHPGSTGAGQAAGPDMTVTVAASGVPDAPEGTASRAGDGSAEIAWAAPRNDGGADITGYTVVVDGRTFGTARDVTRVVVGGLTNATTYRAVVRTVTAAGTSREAAVSVTPRTGAPAPSAGTVVCGAVDRPSRLTAAGSPYRLCPAGVVVRTGGSLELDATDGGLVLNADGSPGIHVRGGDLRTAGTAAGRGVMLQPGADPTWGGITVAGSPGGSPTHPTADLHDTVLRGARTPVAATEALRVALRGSTVTTSAATGAGVSGYSTPLLLSGVSVTGPFENGVTASGWHDRPITVVDSSVDGARGSAVVVRSTTELTLRRVRVLRSGQGGARAPAVLLRDVTASVGPGGDVDALTGAGNGIDGVVLSGTLTSDLQWVTPTNSETEHPLGHLLGHLQVPAGLTMTVPAGGVVKAASTSCTTSYDSPLCPGRLLLTGGHLSAGTGAVLTAASDGSAGPSTCPSTVAPGCLPGTNGWYGIDAEGAATVRLVDATVRHATRAIGASGTSSVTLTRGAVERSTYALTTTQATSLAVDGTSFRHLRSAGVFDEAAVTAAGAVAVTRAAFADVDGVALRVLGQRVSVTDTTFDHVMDTALDARTTVHPVLQRLTFRNGGSLSDGSVRPLGRPVLDLSASTYRLGPGQDVDALTGSGNALPAVALGGTLSSDLAWVTPAPADVLTPLGYYLGGNLTVAPGRTLTLPAGAVVVAPTMNVHQDPGIALDGASLDARAGGALLTTQHDPAVARTGLCGTATTGVCSGPKPWGGVLGEIGDLDVAGDITLVDATVRDGAVRGGDRFRPDPWNGDVTVLRSSLERSRVDVTSAASLTVQDSSVSGAGIRVARTGRVSVTGNAVTGAPAVGIDVGAPDGTQLFDQLALKQNVVERSGSADRNGSLSSALALRGVRVTLGPGQQVEANTGAANAIDALALVDVTVDNDVTWVTPRNSSARHLLGYVVADVGSSFESASLTIAPGRTLTLPRRAVVKVQDRLTLDGATLDASAGDATLTWTGDATVAPATCRVGAAPTECPRAWMFLEKGATATLTGATVRLPIVDRSGSTSSATDPAHGFVARHVRLAGLHADPTAARLVDVVSSGPVTIAQTYGTTSVPAGPARSEVLNSVVRDAPREGLTVDRTSARVDGVTLTRNGLSEGDRRYPALQLRAATGVYRCLDIQGNGEGVYVHSPALTTVSDSVLTGNTGRTPTGDVGYDADVQTLTETTGVFWGQPGGPAPGQVNLPANLVDVAPAAARPACAGATPVVPPGQPTQVVAQQDGADVVLSWAAPDDDGGAPLTGYLVTTGLGRQVEVTGTAVTLAADAAGPHRYEVRAVNRTAAGPPSTSTAVGVPAPEPSPAPASPTPSPTATSPAPSASPSPSPSPSPSTSTSPSTAASPSPTATSPSPSPPAGQESAPAPGGSPDSGSSTPSPTASAGGSASPTPSSQTPQSPPAPPPASASASTGTGTTGGRYVGLDSPVRVLDTRDRRGARRTGEIVLDLSGRVTDPDATSVVLNVTVTSPSARGFLVAFPSGRSKPPTSNVNFETGQTQANEVVVALSPDRRVSLFVDSASAHVIADLVGSFTTGAGAGGALSSVSPTRAFDSRSSATKRRRGEVVVDLRQHLPAGSTDAILNVTVTTPSARGFVTVFPTGTTRPGTSNVNFEAGQTQANEVVTRVGTGANAGRVSLFVDSADAAVIVDVVGAVTSEAASSTALFTPLDRPVRALDTRSARGVRRSGEVDVTLPAAVPAGATAVVLNVTAVNGSRPGFVTVFPTGSSAPGTSNVNFPLARTQANEVLTGIGTSRSVTLLVGGAGTPAVHLVVDVIGYLAPR